MAELLALEGVQMDFAARTRLFRSVRVRALDGVSLTLASTETLALVGESGSGKTTLGRVALRLLKPTAGRVLFKGGDITSWTDSGLLSFRRCAQGIFQDPFSSLDPFLSVAEIVGEPLVIHRLEDRTWRRDRVRWALEEVRLAPAREFEERYPHMLSGGQRQRVGMARALVLEPELVVADEPVSMIDASSRAEVLYLLRELQERHSIAFLYITHDIATARHFAHRLAVMYLGRIVETGPVAKVISSPLHPYTAALMEAVPEPDPANRLRLRRVIPGEPPSPQRIPAGCRFHPRCPFFMAGTCDVKDPPLQEVQPGRYVACHLHAKE